MNSEKGNPRLRRSGPSSALRSLLTAFLIGACSGKGVSIPDTQPTDERGDSSSQDQDAQVALSQNGDGGDSDDGSRPIDQQAAPTCTVGNRVCDGNTPKVCMSDGSYSFADACGGDRLICVAGQCVACSSSTDRCVGKTVQSCLNNAWVVINTCQYLCVNAACTGSCTPGSHQCMTGGLATCTDTAQWSAPSACPYICKNNACTGVCTPGTVRCDKGKIEICNTDAQWKAQDGKCASQCSAPLGRYLVDLSDINVVTDTQTNLTWMRGDALLNTFQSSACASITVSGKKWRLPSASELLAIVNTTAGCSPTVDQAAFQGTQPGIHWSSTELALAIDQVVDFVDGRTYGVVEAYVIPPEAAPPPDRWLKCVAQ